MDARPVPASMAASAAGGETHVSAVSPCRGRHLPDAHLVLRTQWRTLAVEVGAVTAVSATTARANLYRLIDQVNDESEPLTITGQRSNAVLIGEEDWHAIQETLFLASVPGLTESIRQARAEGIDAGSSELDW